MCLLIWLGDQKPKPIKTTCNWNQISIKQAIDPAIYSPVRNLWARQESIAPSRIYSRFGMSLDTCRWKAEKKQRESWKISVESRQSIGTDMSPPEGSCYAHWPLTEVHLWPLWICLAVSNYIKHQIDRNQPIVFCPYSSCYFLKIWQYFCFEDQFCLPCIQKLCFFLLQLLLWAGFYEEVFTLFCSVP